MHAFSYIGLRARPIYLVRSIADTAGTFDLPWNAMARVIVVEDDADLADTLVFLLEGSGHEVHAVHDGLAALAEVDRRLPDAVVLDVALPYLDGVQVARRLRERHGRAMRIIGCTAYEPDQPRIACGGFDAVFAKPVPIDELLEAIGEAPSRRHLADRRAHSRPLRRW
jgi:CheY-like chemotaxis protein